MAVRLKDGRVLDTVRGFCRETVDGTIIDGDIVVGGGDLKRADIAPILRSLKPHELRRFETQRNVYKDGVPQDRFSGTLNGVAYTLPRQFLCFADQTGGAVQEYKLGSEYQVYEMQLEKRQQDLKLTPVDKQALTVKVKPDIRDEPKSDQPSFDYFVADIK